MISDGKPEATLVSPQIEQEVVDGHHEDADQRELPRGAPRDAQAGAARQADGADDDGGEQRARGAHQRRREMQAGDVDGAVGRAPEEVHAGEGDGDAGFDGDGKGICS